MNNHAIRYRSFGAPSDQLVLEQSELTKRPSQSLRVAMLLVPVNPSDLIPVTGAYVHRIKLPAVAGYEGVGEVVEAPSAYAGLIGQRVLPLRGNGTWQRFVDCDPALAVAVPDDIDETVAARSYINPLAALCMLRRWPVHGKRVLLTGAGSTCANILGLWARRQGALEVTGIYRSYNRVTELERLGIKPLHISDRRMIADAATQAKVTFDALGGVVASAVLETMRPGSTFVGYGLLTGKPVASARKPHAQYRRFHLRDELATMAPKVWQQQFCALWPRLRGLTWPEPQIFALDEWREAIAAFAAPGRKKPMIAFR